jgi:four helix bundle protein
MKKSIIKDKSFDFALEVIKLYKYLCENKKEFVMSRQLLKSGTAIGALVRESEHAESKIDFIHKMAIAQKEANETDYWIELLLQSEYIENDRYIPFKFSIEEIRKILSSIIVTTKKNLK